MFKLIAIAGLALAGVANAGTLTLNATPCGVNTAGVCAPYQAGALGASDYISLKWTAAGNLTVQYWTHDDISGLNTLSAEFSGAVGYPVAVVGLTTTFANVVLTDSSGAAVSISGGFTDNRKCVRSGRGQTCTNQVVFIGGTLVQ